MDTPLGSSILGDAGGAACVVLGASSSLQGVGGFLWSVGGVLRGYLGVGGVLCVLLSDAGGAALS